MTFQIDARSIQAALSAELHYTGVLDGRLGPLSKSAVAVALTAEMKNMAWRAWPWDRQLLAYEQMMMRAAKIEVGDVDGLMGPQTLYGLELWQNHLRDLTPTSAQIDHMPNVWPRQSDVPSYYGDMGKHIVKLALPYPMVLAWDRTKLMQTMALHEKVAESAGRAFGAVLSRYGIDEIKRLRLDQYGGSFNIRKMRGGSNWSMHSWGVAIDMDPSNNQFRWGRDRATLDADAYIPFWHIWESEGWISLGRERNYDWMHFQAARL